MRRLGFLTLSAVLLVSIMSGGSFAAETPDEQYVASLPPTATAVGVNFMDGIQTRNPSYLMANIPVRDANGQLTDKTKQALCASVDDATCLSAIWVEYIAHRSICQTPTELDCIESVFAVKPDGTRVQGTFVGGMPEDVSNPFQPNLTLKIPAPSVDGIWNISGVVNGGSSETYAVSLELSGYISKQEGRTVDSPIPLTIFDVGIFPVKIVEGMYKPGRAWIAPGMFGLDSINWDYGSGMGSQSCVLLSKTQCALHEAFPMDVTFGLSLRLSQEMKGWLHGRMREPDIIYHSSATGTTLVIQGRPIMVPVVSAWTERGNLPADVPVYPNHNPPPGFSTNAGAWGDDNAQLLKIWLPIIKDTAQAQPSEWTVRNLSASEMSGEDKCMSDGNSLDGIVTTNSTVYSAGPPTFNPNTQSLDYTLASPHFTSRGDVFKGVYTLAIRSSVARCIYRFTSAPIKATISVTDDQGTSSVAIESMTEHDGWIYLSASNFEFSSPTVHIKLSQDAPAVPLITPSPSASATPSPHPSTVMKKAVAPSVKKTSITCMKGKTVKKIYGISPKCPTGYMKK